MRLVSASTWLRCMVPPLPLLPLLSSPLLHYTHYTVASSLDAALAQSKHMAHNRRHFGNAPRSGSIRDKDAMLQAAMALAMASAATCCHIAAAIDEAALTQFVAQVAGHRK